MNNSNLTWSEQITARLRLAKEQEEHYGTLARQAKEEREALETLVRVNEERSVLEVKVSDIAPTPTDVIETRSVHQYLLDYGHAQGGVFHISKATDKVKGVFKYGDRKPAAHIVRNTVYRYKNEFQKVRDGVFRVLPINQQTEADRGGLRAKPQVAKPTPNGWPAPVPVTVPEALRFKYRLPISTSTYPTKRAFAAALAIGLNVPKPKDGTVDRFIKQNALDVWQILHNKGVDLGRLSYLSTIDDAMNHD